MKIFGLPVPFTITITKDAGGTALATVPGGGRGWTNIIRETFAGAWQRNVTVERDTVLSFHAVFACQTLISSDIAKLRARLMAQSSDGIWQETSNPAYSPVLRKPNAYQNRIQFYESWVLSKLQWGNTYVLKQRDNRNVVVGFHVLDPTLVTPLVADNGDVYYRLNADRLAGQKKDVVVPAMEMIHDRFNCLFHPLVGQSPIMANGLAAMHGSSIQNSSTKFFQNQSQPGGILTAPGAIRDETANRLKETWSSSFSGENAGKIAVLGDGLKFEPMNVNPNEAQLIEQLKWTADVVCSTYHVPPYKIGIGAIPSLNNVQAMNTEYYTQCLQVLIESIELCLDEGLGIGEGVTVNGNVYGTEFDIDNLLRMDSVTQMQVLENGKNYLKPNEGRKKLDLPPVEGGDAVYRQQQDFSIAALAKRDAKDDPFAKDATTPALPTPPNQGSSGNKPDAAAQAAQIEMQAQKALRVIQKGLAHHV